MGDVFSAKKNGSAGDRVDSAGIRDLPGDGRSSRRRRPTFDQIKAKVEDQFKTQRAQQMLAQKTQELADRAHAEHDLKKAAKELGATVKTSDLVGPTAQVPDIGSLTGAASVRSSP